MARQIFVNLPVKDLNRSIEFSTRLGFTFNAQFTNENATCMIVGENIFVMLLVERFFKSFTTKEISDATRTTEVLVAISADSREEVDDLVQKAVAAGGRAPNPRQDHGWMYGHGQFINSLPVPCFLEHVNGLFSILALSPVVH